MGSTLEDVAARAGVSRATASRALTGHPYVAAATGAERGVHQRLPVRLVGA